MKVLIVDDEPLARRRLARLLARMPDLHMVGEATDGEQALERIRELTPDLVLLDIDMPGLDGLSLAKQLSRHISVVFTTAHREHAVDAFAVDALDYLLKPIDEQRLAEALARARARRAGSPAIGLEQVIAQVLTSRTLPTRLAARNGDAVELLDPALVTRLFASDKYTLCRVAEREYILDESLSTLEHKLASHGFVRVHRGELVNLHAIRSLHLEDAGPWVELSDGQRAQVSRRSLPELKHKLGLL